MVLSVRQKDAPGVGKGREGGLLQVSGERASLPWACAPASRNTLLASRGTEAAHLEEAGAGTAPCAGRAPRASRASAVCKALGSTLEGTQGPSLPSGSPVLGVP